MGLSRLAYGSVCSGIEAATVAWQPLGWRSNFYSEIEPFARSVLAHHYPATPLHGDFTSIQSGQYEPIDLLVGGTPCQSFSVAGLRGGLADERGNLALEYLRLADRLRPRWLVWENVPGVLSSNGGRDFGCFLGGLVKFGYGFAYRVLDAQYLGLAQQRKRVFVVGYLGDWRRAAAVLFEPESLRWNPPPRRKAGQKASGTLSARSTAGGGLGTDFECNGGLIAHTLRGEGFDASEDGTGRGTPLVVTEAFRTSPNTGAWNTGDRVDASTTGTDQTSHVIVQPYTLAIRGRDGGHDPEYRQDGTANALLTPNGGRGGIGVGAVAYALETAPALTSNPYGDHESREGLLVAFNSPKAIRRTAAPHISRCLLSRTSAGYRGDAETETLIATLPNDRGGEPGRVGGHNLEYREDGTADAQAVAYQPAVAFDIMGTPATQGARATDVHSCLRSRTPGQSEASTTTVITNRAAVRRLTPRECERLQGFPDDYTAIQFRRKPAADGNRYRALGNSMAVPCMAWIGQRIAMVDAQRTVPANSNDEES